ncbi:phosphoadenosine phosphosulfate reductase [Pedobacter sp. KBW01]|uniref:phosphoadenosine phosphosulfate reductase domain-containing protein n=1 Tax=Pedobacter sp. KBW01 TaxID=2153364 RepID=UPI000F5B7085|nr:phosphoadenosine phosphosulfate reductase family protein [Pedobacter sp. KBW01]RQO79168.1 phosphoadenosine phosphosulfate reductase [Pedobacter sp. KBW01]
MKYQQADIFLGFGKRLQMNESIQLTINSLLEYCPRYEHWCLAWSGGKDSTTLVTVLVWLINTGQIPKPKSITIMYADSRMELPPLAAAAQDIISDLREMGFEVRIVTAPIEKRFFPYMLGRGVPPPTNKFRWCTPKLKVDPMESALKELFTEKGQKVLMLTGVRMGESAVRDNRIIMSCSKDDGECGQGWYQQTMPTELCDTLAPILHWRVCHVWAWLKNWATLPEYGDFATAALADAYGGDEAEDLAARTGCIECNLVKKDNALTIILRQPKNKYLKPLRQLRGVYNFLRSRKNRLRKTGLDEGDNFRQRFGPITMGAREWAFNEIIRIQNEINEEADRIGRPRVILIDEEEQAYIKQCWKDNLWPNRWDGNEAIGSTPMDTVYPDGTIQPLIKFGE